MCPGPVVRSRPPVLSPGSTTSIEDAYAVGCDDTGPTWGCAGETRQPLSNHVLRLRQRGRGWEAGTSDASGGEIAGHVEWTVTVPGDLRPGRATLRADRANRCR